MAAGLQTSRHLQRQVQPRRLRGHRWVQTLHTSFIPSLLQLMAYSCVVFSLTFKIKDTCLMNLQSCRGSQKPLMHFCPILFKQRVVWEIICIVAGDCSLTIHDVDGAIDEGLWQCGVTSSSPELQDSLVSAPARLAVQGGFAGMQLLDPPSHICLLQCPHPRST